MNERGGAAGSGLGGACKCEQQTKYTQGEKLATTLLTNFRPSIIWILGWRILPKELTFYVNAGESCIL